MKAATLALEKPPEARAETVEDLVRYGRSGRIRVPDFQRGLKWNSQQVLDLFDSIHRGLPIGSLLLQRRRAEAERIHLGPLAIDAESTSDGWWVVDGQQRLTSLAASLARPLPLSRFPTDPFVVYFDPVRRTFHAPHSKGDLPSEWVPLPLLLDAASLSEWVFEWKHKDNRELVRAVFEAGKRLREYRVPLYIIDTDEREVLQEIFFRVNKAGKPLTWNEVHDALYGHDGASPSTTKELSHSLASLGMGQLRGDDLTSCLVALRGLDVTRTLAEHRRRSPAVLRGAVFDALPVLRQVLSFLRKHAGVPHLRLLPRTFVLEALTRFFALHPEPSPRTMELLSRWVWRALLGATTYDERTLRRRAIAAIGDNEEASAQELLGLLSREPIPVSLPDSFDARSARSRLALLALPGLRPRDLGTGQIIDVAELIEEQSAGAFRTIIGLRKGVPNLARGPANRMLHPGVGPLLGPLLNRVKSGDEGGILASHAITPPAAKALAAGALSEFLQIRERELTRSLSALATFFAGWERGDRDRPSIEYLLRQGELV